MRKEETVVVAGTGGATVTVCATRIPFLPNLCPNKWFIRQPVNDFGCVAPW